jgi:predicted amidohydrolase
MAPVHKVATVQFEPTMFEKERNVEGLLALCEEAARAGAALIVTPEMGTTGYCWFDREEVAGEVEPVPGPTTRRFEALCAAYGCHVVIGMPEVDPDGVYFNSAVLIGPEGVVGVHRKSHPYIAEPKWAASGDLGHQVFETPIGRIALLICMDIHFIETARLCALGGADVICHISNWLAERTPAPYWISRAFENGCYVIEANRWGLERTVQFSGGSCIIEPDGSIAAVIDAGDGIAYGEIDLAKARARTVLGEPVMDRRRPELYRELLSDTFLWNPCDFFGLYGHRPLPPGRRSQLAAAQFTPSADMSANLARIASLAEDAKRSGAELVVFPELAVNGLENPAATAQPTSGMAVAALIRMATKLRMHIVAGFAEKAGTTVYNAAALVGPEGLVAVHRKLHPGEADRDWAAPGEAWTVADTPAGRIGLLIGHDALYPEAARVLALRGCDIVACPAAIAGRFAAGHPGTAVAQGWPIPTGADPLHWHHFRVRAGENNVFLAFANVHDEAGGYEGLSGVFGPDTFEFPRREAIVTEPSGIAVATVDTTNLDNRYPSNTVRRKDIVCMRLTHHYRELVRVPNASRG